MGFSAKSRGWQPGSGGSTCAGKREGDGERLRDSGLVYLSNGKVRRLFTTSVEGPQMSLIPGRQLHR